MQPSGVTNEPRVGTPCKPVEPLEEFTEIANDVKFQEFPEEIAWPGDEEALAFEFGTDVPQKEV
jgi:hypothetical protein